MPSEQRKPTRVLVVEDDQATRDALVHLLAGLGYRAIPAANVADGLALLDGQAFAILDLNLPDGLGTQILQRIRAEKRPIRVALATASSDPDLLTEALNHGPDLILRKPFNVNVLLEWLEASD